jgi:hypothetical protein
MSRLLTLKYYFTPLPDPNFQYTKLTLAVGLILIIAGFALGFYRKKYMKDEITKRIIKKYPNLLKTYGLLLLLLLLIREAGIPYLSMRFWWILLGIFFAYSLIKFLATYKKKYTMRLEQAEKMHKMNKYLPKKKR